MSWLVPRPASLKLTVSDPSLFRLALAKMKCSFWANACWAMRAKATKTNATTAILLFMCCTSPHRDAAPVVGGAWPRGPFGDGQAAVPAHVAIPCLAAEGGVEGSRCSGWAVAWPLPLANTDDFDVGR